MTYFNAVKYIKCAPVGDGTRHDEMLSLLGALGNPHKRTKYIRLAGSNGKTVCAEMLVSALSRAGYRVGCLRMPIREEPRHNICIGRETVSIDEFCEHVNAVKCAVNEKKEEQEVSLPTPTAAEILLATALLSFHKHRCDICIIESDHFGEDPSRALPPPFAAVICGTIPSGDNKEISRIRSYICRGIQEIISAPQDTEAYRVISDTCYSINCRLTLPLRTSMEVEKLTFSGTQFRYKDNSYTLKLCGRFQVSNAVLTLEVLQMLRRKGFNIPDEAIHQSLSTLKIPAKLEVVSIKPLMIVDSTHTPVAVKTVCSSLAEFRDQMSQDIRLCLPDAALVTQYVETLTQHGYKIESILVPDSVSVQELDIPVIQCKTNKALAKKCLADLDKDTVLLISGDYPFVNPVRYELLATMGF